MKKLLATLTAVGCLAGTVVATSTPADAYVVRKDVRVHRRPDGAICRNVRVVKNGIRGRRVIHKRICH